MAFWQVFLVFSVLAALSLAWPFVRHFTALRRGLKAQAKRDADGSNDTAASIKLDFHTLDAVPPSVVPGRFTRRIFLVMCVLLPICALVLYGQLGAKEDWNITQMSRAMFMSSTPATREERQVLVDRLQARLQQRPENGQLWFMLGAAATDLGDFELAVQAYMELLVLYPDSSRVRAELAQSLFMRAGNTVTPEVRKQTAKALEIDPQMPTALGLAGIDAFQSGKYEQAIGLWQAAVQQLDPNSSAARVLSGGIASAKEALAKNGLRPSKKAVQKPASDDAKADLLIHVSLGEEVTGLTGNETVFVYARAWQGSKMPLAIQRIQVSELPKIVRLNSDTAMAQGMDIHSAPELEAVARVSLQGSASPQAGDWTISKGPIVLAKDSAAVELIISEQLR